MDNDIKIIDRTKTEYCQQCAYVSFYDWYLCCNPEHPIYYYNEHLPMIFNVNQAESCILFKEYNRKELI